MSWRTIVVLLLAVVGLAYFALRTAEHEEHALADQSVALFPGLDANLVTALRIENVGRDLHMRFERDPTGGWQLTDPVAARAEATPLDLIVQASARTRGTVVPDEESRELARLGLDPPRFVLTFEVGSGPDVKRQRAEFGAPELDTSRMFARVDGRALLVSRELEAYLDMQLHELRASSLSSIDARTVLEFERTGARPSDGMGPTIDASFRAVQDRGVWRSTAPVEGLLDPAAIGLYLRSIVNYRYESVFDEGSRSLSALGLDPPELTLRCGTIGTEVVEVVLGRTGTTRKGGWVGTRTGSSVVWHISGEDVAFFALPLEDLLDHRLIRARRGAVERVEISSSIAEVRLVRGSKGWTCATARAGSGVFGPEERAETRAVEDVIGELERYELSGFVRGASFDAGPAPVTWRVVADDGESAGTFGGPYVDAAGATDVLFQRAGDTVVGHGDPAIVAHLTRAPEQFLSLQLLEASEVDLSGIRLRGATSERRFLRNAKGLWTHPGGDVEARELHGVLDSLLFLRASERLPETQRVPLDEPIVVELEVEGALRSRFEIGLAKHGEARRAETEFEGGRAVLLDAALHAKLSALLADAPTSEPR